MNKILRSIVDFMRAEYPGLQAVYVYGSFGTEYQNENSDLDLGLLLSPTESKSLGWKEKMEVVSKIVSICHCEVDIINMRCADTVICKEIIMDNRCIYSGDEYERQTFEMLTLSYYQKLNEERADIIASGIESGRFV